MRHLDSENLEVAVFTGELMQLKLDEIAALNTDQGKVSLIGSAMVREAATAAYHQQLGLLCSELGELAITVPADQVVADTTELRATVMRSKFEADAQKASVTEYGAGLATLLPFASTEITTKAKEVTDTIEPIDETDELSDEEKTRLEKLTKIERILMTPIQSSAVVNHLLSFFETFFGGEGQEPIGALTQHSELMTIGAINRQLTKYESRDRLIEYFTACVGYPVEVTTLADAVYVNDSRNRSKKHTMMSVITNPKQPSSKPVYQALAKSGLVLQLGWRLPQPADGEKNSRKKRVLRSLVANEYLETSHLGKTTDGVDYYTWEAIDDNFLNDARSK